MIPVRSILTQTPFRCRLTLKARRPDHNEANEFLTVLANHNPLTVDGHTNGRYWGTTPATSTGVAGADDECSVASVFENADA